MTLRRSIPHDHPPQPHPAGRRPLEDHTPAIDPASTGAPGELVVREVNYHHPDAVTLVSALFEEQSARYGYADPVDADPLDYRPPGGAFLVAYLRGRPVACGGCRPHRSPFTIEIKKMYTVPEHRGHGYGRLLLAELERRATDLGANKSILETGVRNHSALALYAAAGYQPAASYVPGRDPAINRAFAKSLGPPEPPS